jgi:hypothetical protein
LSLTQAEAIVNAAPLLRTFAADLYLLVEEARKTARRVLLNEAPFGALRVRRLCVSLLDEDEASVVSLAADVAAHASLEELALFEAPLETAAALDAVVDAALAHRLWSVSLQACALSPASMAALARLLSGGALTELECSHTALLDAPAAGVLAAALRANSTLTSLTLVQAGVFDDPTAAAALLGALTTGHASLRSLSVCRNGVIAAHQAAAGAALGALVAANAPALTELNVSWCNLGDAGLRPLFDALPANAHLRTLHCSDNDMSQAFARDVLLPAVHANSSLRFLGVGMTHSASAHEAEALVARRPTVA